MSRHIVGKTFILTEKAKRLLEEVREIYGLSVNMTKLFYIKKVTLLSYYDEGGTGVRIKFKEIGQNPYSDEGYVYSRALLHELLKQGNRIMEVE